MPWVFLIIGLVFLVSAIRGTESAMFALIKSEFWGSNSFVPWVAAIVILGAIGYAKPVRPAADAMIGLIILVMILANKGGFFTQFNSAIRNPVAPATDAGSGGTAASNPGAVLPALGTGSGAAATGSGYTPNGGVNILNGPADPIDISPY